MRNAAANREEPAPARLLRARRKAHSAVRHVNTILVIEDDAEMRRLLAHTLERAGYAVVTARSGGEAVEWLGLSVFDGSLENAPDLIVSDIRLPDFSGLDLLEAMIPALERVPMILITGFPSPETFSEALERGAARLLEKPFEMEALRGCVRDVLREHTALAARAGSPRPRRT
ncbi:MAG TPA: response regulator [Myxococcota bacterium]|jgi:DNA-binding NtrC family response regulator